MEARYFLVVNQLREHAHSVSDLFLVKAKTEEDDLQPGHFWQRGIQELGEVGHLGVILNKHGEERCLR